MLQSILDLVKSNKFKVALFSVLALICSHFGAGMPWSEVISNAWPIVVAYLGAQGLADFGKNRVIVEQREISRRQRELEVQHKSA